MLFWWYDGGAAMQNGIRTVDNDFWETFMRLGGVLTLTSVVDGVGITSRLTRVGGKTEWR